MCEALVRSKRAPARLTYPPLFEGEQVAVVPPAHPLATRAHREPHHLAEEHLILCSTGKDGFVLKRYLDPAGVRPRRPSHVQVTEGILELVKAAVGVTILSWRAAWAASAAGTLVAVPLSADGSCRSWYAATRNGNRPPYVDQLIVLLARLLGAVTPWEGRGTA